MDYSQVILNEDNYDAHPCGRKIDAPTDALFHVVYLRLHVSTRLGAENHRNIFARIAITVALVIVTHTLFLL